MKKIMIALIACAMGVAAQAATVTWVASYIRVPEDDPGRSEAGDAPYSDYRAYLIDLANFSDPITAANYRDAIGAATLSAELVRGGTSAYYGKVPSGTTFESPYGRGEGAYVMLIIDSLELGQEANFVVSGTRPLDDERDRVYFNFNEITPKDSGTGRGAGWMSIAVPEPTSAMLLLLGLSGLALKRRRA